MMMVNAEFCKVRMRSEMYFSGIFAKLIATMLKE